MLKRLIQVALPLAECLIPMCVLGPKAKCEPAFEFVPDQQWLDLLQAAAPAGKFEL